MRYRRLLFICRESRRLLADYSVVRVFGDRLTELRYSNRWGWKCHWCRRGELFHVWQTMEKPPSSFLEPCSLGHQKLALLSRPGRFRRLHSTFPLPNSSKELASSNLGDEPDDSTAMAYWVSMSRYDRCAMERFISRSRAAGLRRQLDIQGQAKTKQTGIALSNVMLALRRMAMASSGASNCLTQGDGRPIRLEVEDRGVTREDFSHSGNDSQ